MASNTTIKAIESSTVHQIQSGQVIVDLCSVAKELVENSVDAGATTVDVRFKNQGLDSIEVQDNGSGIASHNYESIALKHYTSKLSSYDDLSELQTFGFRGEALSSLCALSRFSVVTCTKEDAPRAARLEFETSGKLKSTSVVSGQRGTTVIVEDLFHNLPVRRRELERNIKREWGKVVTLLNQYACVQTGVKFSVSQQPTKGKRMVLFSTKGNATTRENIINVFGVKTMNALITMDLRLELKPTAGPLNKGKALADGRATEVRVLGHISRPAHGEGRQTPDRQMFYVNGRPCGLPQFAKVFNEVYRSYNSTQSPFIFADIQLDTHLYDVNVSPDKRTILLHDQGQMLDHLRESLIELFEMQDVTIPISQAPALRQTPFKMPTQGGRSSTPISAQPRSSPSDTARPRQQSDASFPVRRSAPMDGGDEEEVSDDQIDREDESDADDDDQPQTEASSSRKPSGSLRSVTLLSRWLAKPAGSATQEVNTQKQPRATPKKTSPSSSEATPANEGQESDAVEEPTLPQNEAAGKTDHDETVRTSDEESDTDAASTLPMAEPAVDVREDEQAEPEPPVPAIALPSQPPALRSSPAVSPSRPFKRPAPEMATITIGDHTVTTLIGEAAKRPRVDRPASAQPGGLTQAGKRGARRAAPLPSFGGRLSQMFSASAGPGEVSSGKIGVTAEDADEDIEDDESMEAASEGNEEDEEEGLFVSQAEKEVSGDEEDGDMEEPEDSALDTTQAENMESQSNSGDVLESAEPSPSPQEGDAVDNDGEYVDEEEKKAREDKKVQQLIDAAEAATAEPTEEGEKRSQMFVKGRARRKDMTLNLVQHVKTSADDIQQQIAKLAGQLPPPRSQTSATQDSDGFEAGDAEEKLSLKISKSDFAKMRIVGQFNLGFILAVRPTSPSSSSTNTSEPQNASDDELFIIDQHASDEKYNFERLQSTTTLQPQRLVQPKPLLLTALEEELVLEHLPALARNGFLVDVDTSGARPVGARARLLSLPLSRETTFSVADLEELLVLLADNPTSSCTTAVPRPSRVRRLLAMRACRSSIMVGRALAAGQMARVVRHMGEMEKPWNCPHGRPTMRHLCGLGGAWDARGWREDGGGDGEGNRTDWASWVRKKRGED